MINTQTHIHATCPKQVSHHMPTDGIKSKPGAVFVRYPTALHVDKIARVSSCKEMNDEDSTIISISIDAIDIIFLPQIKVKSASA